MDRDRSTRTVALMLLACAAVAVISAFAFDRWADGREAECRSERIPDMWFECARDDLLARARGVEVVVLHRDVAVVLAVAGIAGTACGAAHHLRRRSVAHSAVAVTPVPPGRIP